MSDELLHLNGRGRGEARGLGRTGQNGSQQWLRDLDERVTQNLAAMRVMVGPLRLAIADLAELVAAQVAMDRTGGAVANFAIPTTATAIHSLSIPVPDGYSRALVMAVASMSVYSLSTPTSGLYLKAAINETTVVNATSSALDPANGFNWAALSSSASATLTGLAGGSVSIRACARSTNALPADSHNVVNLDGMAVFLR